jgi:predicted phosphate transport protein (TIGR00153 family)
VGIMAFNFKNIIKQSDDKKDKDFYNMLYLQSEKTLEGVEHLYKYIINNTDAEGDRVIEIEEEADELRRILISALDQTFITPFEREDIYNLSRAIDDLIDYSESTIGEMRLFKLESDDNLKKMAEILLEETKALNNAVKHLKAHKGISSEQLVKAKIMENKMEIVYRNAISELLDKDDFKYILKMREIYRHMSNAADRGDEAANVIGHIIVKMT